jgi:hypothetical protein
MKKLLVVLFVLLAFSATPVSAGGGYVQLAHMSFSLPDYISPVDVSTAHYARFDCVPPDTCAVYADFLPVYDFFPDASQPTLAYVNSFESSLADGGIYTLSTGDVQTYRTSGHLAGDRVRFFVTSGGEDFAIDLYVTYGTDGGVRTLVYLRPAAWTLSADGNGQPIFERMLDSLTIHS